MPVSAAFVMFPGVLALRVFMCVVALASLSLVIHAFTFRFLPIRPVPLGS